ncbi:MULTISPECIES: MotA/TolQ/ExbB proton channel family protein [unclassified Moraxella]|uniref:MotA/TolQ/ExbB proton channel family protein n=1 Tax=unclassified Moraxella TaxID=2685852 RepID=UPI003AF83EFD
MDFANYWQYTDLVTKVLFFILIGLSLLSWVVGITRLINSQKLAKTIQQDLRQAITTEQSQIGDQPAELRKSAIEQYLLKHLNQYRFDSEKGLSVLGTTASIAPFVGLFGTVWGIFHALHRIGQSGQAGLGQVAGPVGEALIMTGLGLAVAIPAVVFYNLAVRLNRKALHLGNDTAHALLAQAIVRPSVSASTTAPHPQSTHLSANGQTSLTPKSAHTPAHAQPSGHLKNTQSTGGEYGVSIG